MEKIKSAAIRYRGGFFVLPAPARHGDIFRTMTNEQIKEVEIEDQGFMTTEDQYVNRVRARQIAEVAGQLLPTAYKTDELFTEDIW